MAAGSSAAPPSRAVGPRFIISGRRSSGAWPRSGVSRRRLSTADLICTSPELKVAGRRFSIGGRWSLSRARGSADLPPPSRSPSPARRRGAVRRRSSSGSRTLVPGSRTPDHLPRRCTAPPPRLHRAFRSRHGSATAAPPQATVPSRAAAPFAPPRHALHRLQRPRLCRATRPPARPAGGPASASPCHQATRTVPPSHRCKGLQRDGWALSSKRMDLSCCSTLLCSALLCLVLLCSTMYRTTLFALLAANIWSLFP
jgi:hypothetical protein